ncbi:sigma-70 family RNA polymerase sigma factor [Terrabacter sp. GCM10028922]|uniref:sigma-70 family RNA polymerase sigma factor n=1 Tax=Terrabacter sp. GCM10028922 TaxID=3273428 RepID=UPI00361144CF
MSADATLWSSEAWASAPDGYLLQLTREGSAEAFGELWRRHLPAAYAVAGRHRGRAAPDDIVAEAAARVFSLIRDGRGPDEHFRAYFLSAVRTVAIDQGRRDLRLVPTEPEDLDELTPPLEDPFAGLAVDEEGLALVREAFAGLSERDQRVLWHTTVEGAAPRAVAPVLGMTANAVSVRAMRARESLRALYLDARAQRGLAHADDDECRWTISHLGALVRGRLPRRQTERAEAHVADCPHAASLAADLRLIHDGFPSLLVPLVLTAGLGTPGFVSAAVLTGSSGVLGAEPGSGSAGAADGSSTPTTDPLSSASSSGASGIDAAAQVASRVAGLVASVAVTAGVAGALALPGSPPPPAAGPTPSAVTATAPRATSAGSTPSPAATAPRGQPVSTVSASAIPSVGRTARRVTVTGTPSPVSSTVDRPAPDSVRPTPDGTGAGPGTGTQAPGEKPPTAPNPKPPATTTPPPPPTTTPPPAGAPTMTARLVSDGDPARISVRVRSQILGTMTVRISIESGSGRLTVRNSSWTCAQTSGPAVTCTGGRGQALLEQSGTGGVEPVVVRVSDAAGHTWTEILTPS